MRIYSLTPNCHLITLKDGREVLFSYDKPVAGFVPGEGYYITEVAKGKATMKHINVFLRDRPHVVPQEFIENIGEGYFKWEPPAYVDKPV